MKHACTFLYIFLCVVEFVVFVTNNFHCFDTILGMRIDLHQKIT